MVELFQHNNAGLIILIVIIQAHDIEYDFGGKNWQMTYNLTSEAVVVGSMVAEVHSQALFDQQLGRPDLVDSWLD